MGRPSFEHSRDFNKGSDSLLDCILYFEMCEFRSFLSIKVWVPIDWIPDDDMHTLRS
jgi:hypothetical protein